MDLGKNCVYASNFAGGMTPQCSTATVRLTPEVAMQTSAIDDFDSLASNAAPRIAFALSTKDRTQLTEQMLPGLDCGGFDLFWCDGSTTDDGRYFPSPRHFKHTRLREICYDVTGGPDAAIQFALKKLLSLGYDFVGLIENDISLKTGWLQALVEAWNNAQADGFTVGSATVRSIASRVLARSPTYVVKWNMGAGMVLFSRAAAQAVLDDYHTTHAVHLHQYYQSNLGVDLSSVWELFMDQPDRTLGSDWHYAVSMLKRGFISVGTIPSHAENIDTDLEDLCRTRYVRSADDALPAHCLSTARLKSVLG